MLLIFSVSVDSYSIYVIPLLVLSLTSYVMLTFIFGSTQTVQPLLLNPLTPVALCLSISLLREMFLRAWLEHSSPLLLIDLLYGVSLTASFNKLDFPDEVIIPDFVLHVSLDGDDGNPLALLLPPWLNFGSHSHSHFSFSPIRSGLMNKNYPVPGSSNS